MLGLKLIKLNLLNAEKLLTFRRILIKDILT